MESCPNGIWSRGLCSAHYARWRDYGDPTFVGVRACAVCGDEITAPPGDRSAAHRTLCKKCGGRKEFRRRNASRLNAEKRAWYADNRQHAIDYAKAYAQANPGRRQAWMDANRATVRQWVQRRRARLRENGVYQVAERDLNRLMRVREFKCTYCRMPLADQTVTWDHIIPIARGGCHSVGNLTPACKPCNSSKGDRTVTEWRMVLKSRLLIAA